MTERTKRILVWVLLPVPGLLILLGGLCLLGLVKIAGLGD